ncbi:MAG: hypothetical protein D6780_00655 [Candidatus Dadabacteria bacterium]|nr:MAG: hypothetical protein D6780_00655 [Candidatus Dadabacteria bacterium]
MPTLFRITVKVIRFALSVLLNYAEPSTGGCRQLLTSFIMALREGCSRKTSMSTGDILLGKKV